MKKNTVIILGGNNPKSKYWIDNINSYIKGDFLTQEFYYSHREDNTHDIDFEKEILRLSQYIQKNNLKEYSIVSKSAGFILSLQGITQQIIKPKTIIGCGLPIEYCKYRNIDIQSLLTNIHIKNNNNILCVQADKDPQGYSNLVKEIISNTIKLYEIQDNTHNYNQFEKINEIVKKFII